jgi:peptidoglycan/LPS O-acetylase OafA/YrhL
MPANATSTNLTGIRAFAASWVIVHHLQLNPALHIDLGPLDALAAHGWLGVDVFFVLSGFILTKTYEQRVQTFTFASYRRFLQRRLAKIYPLHFATFCLALAILLAARAVHYHFHTVQENTAKSAICNLLLLHAFGFTKHAGWNVYSWSVSAEWFAYSVLFFPMLLWLRRVRPWIVCGFGALLWAAYLLICAFALHKNPDLNTDGGILRILPEFVLGYGLYRMLPSLAKAADIYLCAAVVLAALACSRPSAFFLIVVAIMALIAAAAQKGRLTDALFSNTWVVRIGEASYSVYLIQFFVMLLMEATLRKVHLGPVIPRVMAQGLVAAVVIAVGLLIFRYFENPIHEKLKARIEAVRPDDSPLPMPIGIARSESIS